MVVCVSRLMASLCIAAWKEIQDVWKIGMDNFFSHFWACTDTGTLMAGLVYFK